MISIPFILPEPLFSQLLWTSWDEQGNQFIRMNWWPTLGEDYASALGSWTMQFAGQIFLSLCLIHRLRNQPEDTKTITQFEVLHKTDHRACPSNSCMNTVQSWATGNTGLETIALEKQIKLIKQNKKKEKGGGAIKVVMSQGGNYVW